MKKLILISFVLFLCIISCNKKNNNKQEQEKTLSIDTNFVLLKPGNDTVQVRLHANSQWYFIEPDSILEIYHGVNAIGNDWLDIIPGAYDKDTVVKFISRDSLGGNRISVYLRLGQRNLPGDTIFPDTTTLTKIVVMQEALKQENGD